MKNYTITKPSEAQFNSEEYENILGQFFFEEAYSEDCGGPYVLDTHDNQNKKLIAIIEFVSDKGLAAFINNDHQVQCLNAIRYHFEEGNTHLSLSMMSIGGVLNSLTEKDIEKYNESCVFNSGHIKRVFFANGTVWEF